MQVITKLEAYYAEKYRHALIVNLMEGLTDYDFLDRATKGKS